MGKANYIYTGFKLAFHENQFKYFLDNEIPNDIYKYLAITLKRKKYGVDLFFKITIQKS